MQGCHGDLLHTGAAGPLFPRANTYTIWAANSVHHVLTENDFTFYAQESKELQLATAKAEKDVHQTTRS